MKKLCGLLTSLLIGALLAGCATNPYTGERQVGKSAIGAVGGAALGALVAGKGDRNKGALIGAALGGGAGYYMDVQEQKLRRKLEGTGVSVTREGKNIKLNMPGNLTFSTNSAAVQSHFYPVLNSIYLILKEYDTTAVQVSGHTDNVGSDASNLRLSQQRAESVVNYLETQGLKARRFSAVGYGESAPIADNNSASGREQNRRVEIRIVPTE